MTPNEDRNGTHLVLYDGVCGFCNAVCRFTIRRDRERRFMFASLQSATGRALMARNGRDPDALDTFCVVPEYASGGRALLERSDAAVFLFVRLGGVYRAAAIALILPRVVRDRVYTAFAKRRYALFGKSDRCEIPTASERDRFIDV